MAHSDGWRDTAGRRLTDYPRPSVAVDTALLTVPLPDPHTTWTPRPPELCVLLVGGSFGGGVAGVSLPGTFLHEGERLADAVVRSLADKAGVRGLAPRQLRVFDDPDRDERGWVLSVAHVAAVPGAVLEGVLHDGVELRPVREAHGLPFDHDEIVAAAVETLRADYRESPDPAGLLTEPFTLRQLQHVHQAVLGEPLPKDSFRRRMEPLLEPAGEWTSGRVGKPARLFRRG